MSFEEIMAIISIITMVILLLFVFGLMGYLVYNNVAGNNTCVDSGYDSMTTWDYVDEVKYYKCCDDMLGEDNCSSWVRA